MNKHLLKFSKATKKEKKNYKSTYLNLNFPINAITTITFVIFRKMQKNTII